MPADTPDAPAAQEAASPPGRVIDGYRLVRSLGKGGMGHVYLARALETGQEVALKIVWSRGMDDVASKRLEREIKLCLACDHPHIVRILGHGTCDDGPYYVMERLEGRSLDFCAREGAPLRIPDAFAVARQMADALAYLHGRGIIHRDIKPANVFLDSSGRAKLLDFGLAWSASLTVLTRVGRLLGTPRYLPPERLRGGAVDARADLFQLGLVLYEILTGSYAFEASSAPTLWHKILTGPYTPPSVLNPKVSTRIEVVLDNLLRKEPDERYASARDLVADLERIDRGEAVAPLRRASAEPSSPSEISRDLLDASRSFLDPPAPSPPPPQRSRGRRVQRAALAAAVLLVGTLLLLWRPASVLRVTHAPAAPLHALVDLDGLTVTWTTDVACSSRLEVRRAGVADAGWTRLGGAAGRKPTRRHRLLLGDLTPGRRFDVRAVLASGDVSEPIAVTIPRPFALGRPRCTHTTETWEIAWAVDRPIRQATAEVLVGDAPSTRALETAPAGHLCLRLSSRSAAEGVRLRRLHLMGGAGATWETTADVTPIFEEALTHLEKLDIPRLEGEAWKIGDRNEGDRVDALDRLMASDPDHRRWVAALPLARSFLGDGRVPAKTRIHLNRVVVDLTGIDCIAASLGAPPPSRVAWASGGLVAVSYHARSDVEPVEGILVHRYPENRNNLAPVNATPARVDALQRLIRGVYQDEGEPLGRHAHVFTLPAGRGPSGPRATLCLLVREFSDRYWIRCTLNDTLCVPVYFPSTGGDASRRPGDMADRFVRHVELPLYLVRATFPAEFLAREGANRLTLEARSAGEARSVFLPTLRWIGLVLGTP